MTPAIRLALLALAIAGCAAKTAAPPSEAAPKPEAGPLVVSPRSPYAIAIGPDHNIWFTEYQGSAIDMMTPSGAVTRFPIAPDGIAERLTAGPDGAMWFTDPRGNRIGRIALDGKLKYVALPTEGCGPTGITFGADGFIYFSEHAANRIGRMTTEGVLTEFTLRPKSGPAEMAAGPDGAVYFLEDGGDRIGRISKDGTIREYQIPTHGSIPSAIASGPEESIYFAELGAGKIGKLKIADGTIIEFPILPHGHPLGLAVGADGNLWATIPGNHMIIRMTPTGNFTAYGSDPLKPSFIVGAQDGFVYFSEPNERIGRISRDGAITEFEVGK